jgi:hypothetical protein
MPKIDWTQTEDAVVKRYRGGFTAEKLERSLSRLKGFKKVTCVILWFACCYFGTHLLCFGIHRRQGMLHGHSRLLIMPSTKWNPITTSPLRTWNWNYQTLR